MNIETKGESYFTPITKNNEKLAKKGDTNSSHWKMRKGKGVKKTFLCFIKYVTYTLPFFRSKKVLAIYSRKLN